jgi:4-aminobutyrate aminotransferase
MGVTGNRGWSASSLSPFNVSYVHNGYRFRSPFRELDDPAFIQACADDLRDIITTTTAGDVACMIAEPIQGVGGFTVPPDGFFGAMKEVLDEYGILFISDEVQTGWGRTGEHFWGYQAHGITPDVLTFAKGLGNGLSIAGVVAPAALMDSVQANSISTFGGTPLVTAGALANLRYSIEHDLQGNALTIGRRLMEHLAPVTDKFGVVGEVRGKGLMIGIELVAADGRTPNPDAATRAIEHARGRGLLIGKGGLYGNCLRLAPPLSLTGDEADEGAAILLDVLAEVDREEGAR